MAFVAANQRADAYRIYSGFRSQLDAAGSLTDAAARISSAIQGQVNEMPTTDPDRADSIFDYVFRWLGLQFSATERENAHRQDRTPKEMVSTTGEPDH